MAISSLEKCYAYTPSLRASGFPSEFGSKQIIILAYWTLFFYSLILLNLQVLNLFRLFPHYCLDTRRTYDSSYYCSGFRSGGINLSIPLLGTNNELLQDFFKFFRFTEYMRKAYRSALISVCCEHEYMGLIYSNLYTILYQRWYARRNGRLADSWTCKWRLGLFFLLAIDFL